MAKKVTQAQQDVDELRNRLEWIDDERRKAARRLAELEKKVALQEREIEGREQRIKELEEQLAVTNSQLSRLPRVDTQLSQFKDEIVTMLEQYDQRRQRSEQEMERLRRVEQEANVREVAEIRKELPAINRLQNAMELREAEEARLANLIGVLQNRIPPIESRIETWSNDLAYLEEAEERNSRNISEMQTKLVEINKRWEPINNRLDILADAIGKAEVNIQTIAESQDELRQSINSWAEQVQLGEYERNQRLTKWERMLEEQQDVMESYNKQWVTFSDQYKEAKMAVQTLTEWQKHIELQQKEASELARVELNRMQTRWDKFVQERDQRWKNFEVDIEQRITSSNRHERELRAQLSELGERIDDLKQEQELVWRIQTAQTDAIKQIPRIWQEEVENTMAQDPNRRRQPALVSVQDEL